MNVLVIVVGLALAASLVVAVGDRLGLPWPVLMVVLTGATALFPRLPSLQVEPDLILPLLLPPLLWAVARRSSWSAFLSRWRAITTLAVVLVLVSAAAVALTSQLLIGGLGVAGAIALGAIVAPPDPVAVDAVAGSVDIPRRMLRVLQTEGLFNDAVSLVLFQLSVRAATGDAGTGAGLVVLRFGYAIVAAAAIGAATAYLAKLVLARLSDVAATVSLTLAIPFAVYLAADAVQASGVIAVIVAALQLGQAPHDNTADRVVGNAFWRVVELLITGVAFGLIGLELRQVVTAAGGRLGIMVLRGLIVSAVLIVLRVAWLQVFGVRVRRLDDPDGAPRTAREAFVMAWSGMRGLVTLALALSLPDGFAERTQVTVIAVVVLLVTLVGQGLTLPWVVRRSGVGSSAEAENAADEALVARARRAAVAALEAEDRRDPAPDDLRDSLFERFAGTWEAVEGEDDSPERLARRHERERRSELFDRFGTAALDAARQEILTARGERGVDPEAADRILRRLDVRSLAARG